MKTNFTIVSWLALPVLAITLIVPTSNLGAAAASFPVRFYRAIAQ